jgi:hypothetical protein
MEGASCCQIPRIIREIRQIAVKKSILNERSTFSRVIRQRKLLSIDLDDILKKRRNTISNSSFTSDTEVEQLGGNDILEDETKERQCQMTIFHERAAIE